MSTVISKDTSETIFRTSVASLGWYYVISSMSVTDIAGSTKAMLIKARVSSLLISSVALTSWYIIPIEREHLKKECCF